MKRKGFTLAELLITLAILGIIATFTIPKVLNSGQSSEWDSAAKEAIGMVSEAFSSYKNENTLTINTGPSDLTQYFNYVAVDTATTIDLETGENSVDCGNANRGCIRLHSGAMLGWRLNNRFGQATNTHYITFTFDPDGQYSGTTTGPGKAIIINLYYNGRINTSAERLVGDTTYAGGSSQSPGPDPQADWFSWD